MLALKSDIRTDASHSLRMLAPVQWPTRRLLDHSPCSRHNTQAAERLVKLILHQEDVRLGFKAKGYRCPYA